MMPMIAPTMTTAIYSYLPKERLRLLVQRKAL